MYKKVKAPEEDFDHIEIASGSVRERQQNIGDDVEC
jgi:hypothetical protein